MSEVKTNQISTNSGNNIALANSLGLKSYTTTQRDALTNATGDMIYNSTTTKVQVFNGTSWADLGTNTLTISSLVIAGGGCGGRGGGGAGGYINSYASEQTGGAVSTEPKATTLFGVNYTVTVGAGGSGANATTVGTSGSNSVFNHFTAVGGGFGGLDLDPDDGGSGGGGRFSGGKSRGGGNNFRQGHKGGDNNLPGNYPTGGGGGAGAVGGTPASSTAASGDGGAGLSSSITGSAVTRGGGGGGGAQSIHSSNAGSGGSGGGGAGTAGSGAAGGAGTVNTGGGGGGVSYGSGATGNGGNGGSGLVILRWATADATITIGSGLVSSTTTDGSDTVVTFTSGTGTVSFN